MRRILLVSALLALACGQSAKTSSAPDAAPGAIAAVEGSLTVRHGSVGATDPRRLTYVYVDVENRTDNDRQVVVDGVLRDGAGQDAGKLTPDTLRIPARGKRPFALVASREAPEATGAAVTIRHAGVLDHPPSIVVEGVKTERSGTMLVATATVRNTIPQDATATAVAVFHDAQGRIVSRPFTFLSLRKSASQAVRFEGPADAATADVFAGESLY